MKTADGQHGAVGSGKVAADDGLELSDQTGAGDDRIDAGLRMGAVPSLADQTDVDIVGGGVAGIGSEREVADGKIRVHMAGKDR